MGLMEKAPNILWSYVNQKSYIVDQHEVKRQAVSYYSALFYRLSSNELLLICNVLGKGYYKCVSHYIESKPGGVQ